MRRFVLVAAVVTMAVTACGKSSSSSGSLSSYCAFVKANRTALSGDNLAGAKDLKDLGTRVDDSLAIMKSSVSNAPSEVKSDINQVIGAIVVLQKLIKDANGDESKLNQSKVQSVLQNDANVKANERLQKFNKDRCNVDTS